MAITYQDQTEVVAFPETGARQPRTKITYGCPFTIAAPRHVRETLDARRVYVLASRSLSKNTSSVKDLEQSLGDRHIATHVGLTPHVLLRELAPVVQDIRSKQADCLITIGGSTFADAAKIIAIALSQNLNTYEELVSARLIEHPDARKKRTGSYNIVDKPIPRINIPTTLSGGEYTNCSGGCDDNGEKHLFHARNVFPNLVVLDPQLAVTTPLDIWIQSGFRALDHCLEGVVGRYCTDVAKKACYEVIPVLIHAMIKTRQDPQDLEARLASLDCARKAMVTYIEAAQFGASHGIGHQLGPYGVGHGHTSCILLPEVMRYNKTANGDAQEEVKRVIVDVEEVKVLLKDEGKDEKTCDLGDVLDVVIRALGMPRKLGEAGFTGGEKALQEIGQRSMRGLQCTTNAIPITDPNEVVRILNEVM